MSRSSIDILFDRMRGVSGPPAAPQNVPPQLEAPTQRFVEEPQRRNSPNRASQYLSPIGEGSTYEPSPEMNQSPQLANIATSTTPDYLGDAFPAVVPSPIEEEQDPNTGEYYSKFMANGSPGSNNTTRASPAAVDAPPLVPIVDVTPVESQAFSRPVPVTRSTIDSTHSGITHLTYAPPPSNQYDYTGAAILNSSNSPRYSPSTLPANDSSSHDGRVVGSPEKLSHDLPQEETKPLFSPSMQNRALPPLTVAKPTPPKQQGSFELPEEYNIHSDVSYCLHFFYRFA